MNILIEGKKDKTSNWFILFLDKMGLISQIHYINGPETLPPPLSKEEEQIVFQKLMENDDEAKEALIVHNLRLVVYIAKKFESRASG